MPAASRGGQRTPIGKVNIVNQTPWWRRPLRVLDYIYFTEIANYDFRDYVQTCKELHANVVHFHPADGTGGGWGDDKFYFKTSLATKENRDILAEALPLLHEAGIRAVAYVGGHWFPQTMIDQHPEWWVINDKGERIQNLYGDDDAPTCVNGSWREWAFTLLEDLFAYDLDGMMWDGPLTFLGRNACYCDACRAKFQQQYGKEMPPCDRANRADWAELREFSISSLVDFYRESYALVKGMRPDACVYLNAGNLGEPGWLVGRANRRLMPYVDILVAEGGFMYGRVTSNMLKTTASSKLYQTHAGGKPCINAVSPAFGGWRFYHLSTAEMRVLLAEASFGSNPYAAMWIESGKTGAYKGIADVYGFLEANEQYYENTRSAANVALVHSQETVDTYAGLDIAYCDISGIKEKPAQGIGNFSRSFAGFQEMLERLRVPFDVIDGETIQEGGLEAYALVILPNCACLSDVQCKALSAYTAQGGTLVADFETSLLDGQGEARSDFGLTDVFGVHSKNEIYGPRRWDTVHICEEGEALLGPLGLNMLPAPAYNLRLSPAGAAVAAVFGKPLVSNITKDYAPSDEPFLLVNSFGKGKSYYFPGTFSQGYAERNVDCCLDIVGQIIAHETELPVEVSGPPHFLNVSIRKQSSGTILIQIVNYELRPVKKAVPAYDVAVFLRTEADVRGVKALRACRELPFESEAGGVRFVLPELTEFEVIAVSCT